MTHAEFTAKIEDLIDSKFRDDLIGECNRLFKSGAVDPEPYEDNYRLPKNILVVALENTARQYYPPHRNDRHTPDEKVIRNLRKF